MTPFLYYPWALILAVRHHLQPTYNLHTRYSIAHNE